MIQPSSGSPALRRVAALAKALDWPIAAKIGGSAAVLTCIAGIVGAVGYGGIDRLGFLLNRGAEFTTVLTGVNDAGNAVTQFLSSHDPAQAEHARVSIDAANAALHGLTVDDPRTLAPMSEALASFRGEVDSLASTAAKIDGAVADLVRLSEQLSAMAAKAEADAAAKSRLVERNASDLKEQADRNQPVVLSTMAIQVDALRLAAGIAAYALKPDAGQLSKLKQGFADLQPMIADLTTNANWPEIAQPLQAMAADIDTLTPMLDALTGGEGEGRAQAPAAIVKLDDIAAMAAEMFKTIRAEQDKSAEALGQIDSQRSAARVLAGIGRSFGDAVRAVSFSVLRYRLQPGAEVQAAIEKSFGDLLHMSATIARNGMTDPSAQLHSWHDAFAALAQAMEQFNKAHDDSLLASAQSSKLIGTFIKHDAADAESGRRDSSRIMLATLAAALTLATVIALTLTRLIARPISAVTVAMRRLAEGDTSVALTMRTGQDEVGKMVSTLAVFRDALAESAQLRQDQAASEQRSLARIAAERNAIADGFQARMGILAEALLKSASDISDSARALSDTAAGAASQSSIVSHGAEEAASNVTTVASAAEQLTASVQAITAQVDESARIAERAADHAAASEQEIRTLSQAAEEIGHVVGLIATIAGRTNLLALNATIEAARAGEAGRGFAVVASEVKNLAAQTARATEEITSRISGIQTATQRSVNSIGVIVTTIGTIRQIATSIAASVGEQSQATREISTNIQRAAQGTDEMTAAFGNVDKAVERTADASMGLTDLSSDLSMRAKELEQEVAVFVGSLRAA